MLVMGEGRNPGAAQLQALGNTCMWDKRAQQDSGKSQNGRGPTGAAMHRQRFSRKSAQEIADKIKLP